MFYSSIAKLESKFDCTVYIIVLNRINIQPFYGTVSVVAFYLNDLYGPHVTNTD